MFYFFHIQKKKVKELADQRPDIFDKTTKKIKKKASIFSIVTLVMLLMAIMYFVISFWLTVLFIALFTACLSISIYYLIFEKESEYTEYHLKDRNDGIKILH